MGKSITIRAVQNDNSACFQGVYGNNPTYLQRGDYSGDLNWACVFRGITLPRKAKITSAFITMICATSRSGETVTTVIKGEASAAPTSYGATEDFTARTYLATTVAYSPESSWTLENPYNTADISTIISALLAAYGNYSNGAMAFMVKNNGTGYGSGNRQSAHGYAYFSGAELPTLTINYTPPAGGGKIQHLIAAGVIR
jgi:hypothetical protein